MDQAATQSTPQPAPTIDERIASIGTNLLQEMENHPDPNGFGAHRQQQEVEAPEQETPPEPEQQAEADNATPQPVEEHEEVEYEGRTYKLPKELKGALLRNGDYTQKTQVVAERSKQLDRMTQAANVLFQQAQQFAPLFGQAQSLEQTIQSVQSKLTPELEANDPLEYVKSQGKLSQLFNQRQQLMGFMQQVGGQFQAQQAALKQAALDAAMPTLQKEIPDFGKAETQRSMAEYAKGLGFSDADLQAANWSPAIFRTIHKAMLYDKAQVDNAKQVKAVQAKVQNLPPVKSTGRQPSQSREGREKELQAGWKKGGGKLDDPNLDAILKSRLGG